MPLITSSESRIIKRRAAMASSWWLSGGISAANCVAAYQPKGAGSLAASYSNLANPGTYDCTLGVAPAFDAATGWTFASASNQYLKTGIVWTNNQTWSMIVRFSDITAIYGPVLGSTSAGAYFLIQAYWNSDVYFWAGGAMPKTPRLASGTLAIAGNRAYRNGTIETGTIPTGGGTNTAQLYFGSYSAFGQFDGKIQAAAIYSATLTAEQVAALTTAMAAL